MKQMVRFVVVVATVVSGRCLRRYFWVFKEKKEGDGCGFVVVVVEEVVVLLTFNLLI
ncbi:hypothetical protein Hanom_Chr13g01195401 [Helianthus anomalus]